MHPSCSHIGSALHTRARATRTRLGTAAYRVALLVAFLSGCALLPEFSLPEFRTFESGEAPTGFRDVPFGAQEAELRARYPTAACTARDEGGEHDDLLCSVGGLTVGAVPVTVVFQLVGAPDDRQLVNITVGFRTRDYDAIRQAVVERYGPPAGGGGDRLVWRWPSAVVTVSRLVSGGDRGSATISTTEFLELKSKRGSERRGQGKKDL